MFGNTKINAVNQDPGPDAQRTAEDEIGVNEAINKNASGRIESFKRFLVDTTLHGARFMVSESLVRRFAWTLILAVSLAFCNYLAYGTLRDYFHRPFNTQTLSQSSPENGLTFPAVTLCNFNPVNIHRVIHFENASHDTAEIKRLKQLAKVLTLSKETSTDAFLKEFSDILSRENLESFMGLNSHQIEDMLLPNFPPTFVSCSFGGLVCGPENFTSFVSSLFGQCYTFNLGQNGRPLLNATVAGRRSGLKLLLSIQRNSYIDNPDSPYVGITVLVHDSYNFPFMEEYGFSVKPGTHTFCSIKMKKVTNLPAPFVTNCTQRRLEMFRSGKSFAYSKPACLMQCRNNFVIKMCQCTTLEFHANAPVCAPNDTVICVLPALEKFSSSKEGYQCEQDCPQPCSHVEYETSLSYAGLQKNLFVDYLSLLSNGTSETTISTMLQHTYRPFLNMTKSERHEYIDNNIISLNIYFKDLNYDVLKQVPMYEVWGLFASLGGNYSLFLGTSALTVCEFLDYGVRKFCHKILSERKDIGERKSVQDLHNSFQ